MNSHSQRLVALNPAFEQRDGYYAAAQSDEVRVTFTEADQEMVAGQLSALDDCSSFSEELESQLGSGKYLSILKPQALVAFDFSKLNTALEISLDYGNLSRYLAEQMTHVDSIKSTKNAARATAYRCADLANIDIVNASWNELKLATDYYDLILLSDVELIIDDQQQLTELIKLLSAALSSEGVLALSRQNPKPISAWFESDQTVPYEGLYGTLKNRIGSEQWNELISNAGLSSQVEYSVLPNSQHPRTILSRDYVQSNPGAINHFYAAGMVGNSAVNEYLLFSDLAKTENLYELCDSYLLLASKSASSLSQFYDNDFTHFSSPGRRREWRTITSKKTGQSEVIKQRLFADQKHDANNVAQDLAPQRYQQGQSLAGLWLEALVYDAASDAFENKLLDYHRWLNDRQPEYAGALYDILPFNLIVDAQGDYQVIDPEWCIDDEITPEFVLFRALFWFGFHNRQLLQKFAARHGLFSLEDFVVFGLKLAGYRDQLASFVKAETLIQQTIEKQFNQDAIDETLRLPITRHASVNADMPNPKAQVFWYDGDQEVDFSNSAVLTMQQSDLTEDLSFDVTSLDTRFNLLRVDPVDQGGFIKLERIQILDDQGQAIWALSGAGDIAKAASLVNMSFAESDSDGLFMALNDDPQLLFDLSAIDNMANASRLILRLSYQRGADYKLAMQQLGQDTLLQKQFIDDQRNELEALKARYSELNDNFMFLKEVSEKQHKSIEVLGEKVTIAHKHIREKQETIDAQNEMMMRTPSTRIKLFLARLFGKQEQASDAEELEQAVVEQAAMPDRLGQTNEDYALWIEQHKLTDQDIERIAQEIEAMPVQPVFSIVVPVYNIDEEYLMLAINSVRNQLYPYWELCLVDDASPDYHIRPMLKRLAALDERIVVRLNKDNQGIAGASNDAVKLTSGDFVGLLDHDDELSIDALYENAKVINRRPDVGFIYSDEDKVTMDERRVDPFFKPDYSPDLLDSQNYICHFSVISQSVIKQIDGFRLGFDGSQDHDIIIRAIQYAKHVEHIPKVLYHWRKVPGSTADVYDAKSYAWEAGRKAVEARFRSNGEVGEVVLGPLQGTFQVKRDIIGDPKVSIIIPFKDKPELLRACVDSIFEKSSYTNFEIIGVSNNSEEESTRQLMAEFSDQHDNIRFVEKNQPFNFSQLCNYGVLQSSGEFVLLLNNDIEVISEDWLERLIEHAQRKDVGAVGGKLFFPDGRVQHAGVVAGMHGAAGHSHLFFSSTDIGYYGSLMVTRNVSAVTGAMLMVSRAKFDQVGGLDEANLAIAYNDVDLCLKLLDAGLRNIFTPFCQATHHESASRGYEHEDPIRRARFEKERTFFLNKWQAFLDKGDPCFNPNFDLAHHDFKIKIEDKAKLE